MERRAKVIVAGLVLAAGVMVFLFAPVIYVFSLHPGIYVRPVPSYPVYVSLGCKTIGFGTIYSPEYGIALACSVSNTPWILTT